MKTKNWIFLLSAFALVLAVTSWVLLRPGTAASQADIYSDGVYIKTVNLLQDQTFTIETARGTNTVAVSSGRIAVTAADCPDGYCMARGYCSSGADIICLPNRLVIRFSGAAPDGITS
jgi:hypothetical protein